MKAGKLAPEKLAELVLGRFGHRRADVLVPARLGEDAAVLDFGDEVCVVSTDPITGAAHGAGRLAVHVSCNDVAANGATPLGVQVVLLLPEDAGEMVISRLMDEVEAACVELGIEVLGGHTEITSRVVAPIIVTTALGRAAKNRYVTSGGCRPGDAVVVTKGVGLEGTAILAADWGDLIRTKAAASASRLPSAEVESMLAAARGFSAELSAVREGVLAAAFGISAMHDITEGGLYGGLYEMSQAGGVTFRIREELLPIRPATRFICDLLDLDPLGLISSGAMLIGCADGSGLAAWLQKNGVPAYVVGAAESGAHNILVTKDGRERVLPLLPEDELWRFLAAH